MLRTRHGRRVVLLDIAQQYVVTEVERDVFEVTTISYRYRLLDPAKQEIIAYHWHPEGESPVTYPHLHLTSRVRPIELGVAFDPVALAEMHLPTGSIRLADVVRLLIAEFGVAPRRPDWATILAVAVP